jgi:hypothetical protein
MPSRRSHFAIRSAPPTHVDCENDITFDNGTKSLLSSTAVMVTIKVSGYCYRTLTHHRMLRGEMQKEHGQPAEAVVTGRRGTCLVAPGDDEHIDPRGVPGEVAAR